MKQFVYGRQGFYDEVVPNEGDVLFVMPFGTLPDIVLIEQGCHLSIAKIRTLLESVTLRLTRREAYAWRRRRLQPVSFVSQRWGPDYELPPQNE
ncbi:hypothetical protein LIER_33825 [Lithospermum erythrorhizon]|uniref:Uncharacterized protein n=1 Tax=Lithospermum erythrorhizon TaxID=34254 RepID=A0AAV3S1T4_LITER